MKQPRFHRRVENFRCEQCGEVVIGNGFTNHCPNCLWSKHVDQNPGDRSESCRGMMEPVAITQAADRYRILHRCLQCGMTREVRSQSNDSFDAMLVLASAAPIGATRPAR